jgi:hypothetical protein
VAAGYAFDTRFVVGASPAALVEAVLAPAGWLPALPHVRRLEPLPPPAVDGRRTVRYRTTVAAVAPPYRLRWEMSAVHDHGPERIDWRARGDLEGHGTWTIEPAGDGTAVRSTASLRTTRWWMRVLEPVARPVFVRNHDLVMRAGVDALAAHLGTTVVSYHRGDVQPLPT